MFNHVGRHDALDRMTARGSRHGSSSEKVRKLAATSPVVPRLLNRSVMLADLLEGISPSPEPSTDRS
jgi:hypothetical protein